MVAIPVKSRYTVVREACDEPTTEGSVARPDGRRAVQARGVGACDECAGRAGDAGTGAAGGGRWLLVYRGRQAGGSAFGRRGRGARGPVQSGRTGGRRAAAWRRPEGQVRRRRAGAHPGRVATHAGPGAGPDRDLVADDAPTGAADCRGWAARSQHVHHLVRAARGRPELAARPLVVPHRAGEAATQGRRGRGPRTGRDRKKGLIERAYAQAALP